MKRILFRADDLGYSRGVNYGIYDSVVKGVMNNVGVMVNMPATEHGVNLLKEKDITIGLHTNFSAGYPLSDIEKIPSLISSNGKFKNSKEYNNSDKDMVDFDEALIEIEAQYYRFIELFGKVPDYIDGHAINSDNFMAALEHFSLHKNITYLGLPKGIKIKDIKPTDYLFVEGNKVFTSMNSMKSDYDPLVSFKSVIFNGNSDSITMMVFHPGYLDEVILNSSSLLTPRPKEVAFLTGKEVKELMEENEVELIEIKNIEKID